MEKYNPDWPSRLRVGEACTSQSGVAKPLAKNECCPVRHRGWLRSGGRVRKRVSPPVGVVAHHGLLPPLIFRVNQPRKETIMTPPRQIRINVNGVHQFTVKVSQAENLEDVAQRASDTMRLGNMTAHVSPGQINFIPASVKP